MYTNLLCAFQNIQFDYLLERLALTRAHGEQLAELVDNDENGDHKAAAAMAELVGVKLATLSRSLEQLRLKRDGENRLGESSEQPSSRPAGRRVTNFRSDF